MSRRKNNRQSRQEEILGILMITFGILILVSLVSHHSHETPGHFTVGQIENQLGLAGIYISYFLIKFVIGYPSFVFPVIILLIGWNLMRGHPLSNALRWSAYLFIFALYTSIILAIPAVVSSDFSELGFSLSGLVGGLIAQTLFNYLGTAGSVVILFALIIVTVISATNYSMSGLLSELSMRFASSFGAIRANLARAKKQRKLKKAAAEPPVHSGQDWHSPTRGEKTALTSATKEMASPKKESQLEIELNNQKPSTSASNFQTPPPVPAKNNYKYPPLDLLSEPEQTPDVLSRDELEANAQILEDRLLEFGVQSKVVDIRPGPVITRYEVEPAPGVKISRISSLADDLALAMRAKRIRIVAPIPGKAAVGIEIPNRLPSKVNLIEVINSKPFQESASPLTLALGKTISGEPYVTRLDDMPHLLIAGATGSGKSICLNSIIASILYKAHPTQVQMVMIDPKRLELSIFNNLRHHHLTYREDLNEEVVTTAANAISVLKSLELVMDQRYEILARAGVRNIADYNRRLQAGQLQTVENEEPFEPLEYLVIIVDELADLMLTAAREVEEPIARLTQMSRAVGIHLIVATQRPSVDVITGVIKANFPARLAFQVASKTDSRTILDLNGAEKLLGMGDMLFLPSGSPEPIRLHGAFISTEEIEKIISHIRSQPKYPKHKLPVDKEESGGGLENGEFGFSRDALFNEAAKLIVRHQQGSISLLQRRLKVGYARAARLVDELEAAGIVGPFDGSKAREVLIEDESQLEDLGLLQ
ncbi:MAG: DNA translocase FtsK [bacterium]